MDSNEKIKPTDEMIIMDSPSSQPPPSCCLCLNVRSGTIFIGLCNLVIHAASLAAASRMMLHAKNSPHNAYYSHFHQRSDMVNPNAVGFSLAFLTFLVTLMLVYGAIMRRSSMLLPFFFMQVFDIGLYVMGTAGVASYGSTLKAALEANPNFAYHDTVAKMSTETFLITLTMIFVSILIVKVYMLNCIWNCYKHTRSIEASHQRQQQQQQPMMFYATDADFQALLPAYEDIIKEPVHNNRIVAPPPYTTAGNQ